ncbi:MAG: hypothetical protein NW215_00510 [Hyphomicrobiales bacterium]|nr:hypothetical protein [Hyphomicrobiales bacterium]
MDDTLGTSRGVHMGLTTQKTVDNASAELLSRGGGKTRYVVSGGIVADESRDKDHIAAYGVSNEVHLGVFKCPDRSGEVDRVKADVGVVNSVLMEHSAMLVGAGRKLLDVNAASVEEVLDACAGTTPGKAENSGKAQHK